MLSIPNHGEIMNRTIARSLALAAIAVVAASAGNAYALDELFTKHNCTGCHKVDKKLVGPAYKDVAAKYAGRKDAEAYLGKKIKEGGKEVWGPIPMPANADVPDADLSKMVKEILAAK
jgi:cytochrome c